MDGKDCNLASDVVWNLLESEGEFCSTCQALCEEVISKYFHLVFFRLIYFNSSVPSVPEKEYGDLGDQLLEFGVND